MSMLEHYIWYSMALVLLFFLTVFLGLSYKGIDRKLAAHMQARIGPPLVQPFRDLNKLFMKENIVPANAIEWLFNAAPVFCLVTAFIPLLYIPYLGVAPFFGAYGDVIVVLYLLLLPSLALVVGGFASGSPFATIGAQREMVTMMSLEFPLATAIIAIVWRVAVTAGSADVFLLGTIMQYPIWGLVGPLGIVGVLLLLFVLLLVTPGELSKIPFDTTEAETELAGGLLVEYSGRNLGLFYLADAVKTVVFLSLVVALFFPYNISTWLGITGGWALVTNFWFFLLKVFILMFFTITLLRVGVARFRITQVTTVYWLYLTFIGLIGLFLIWADFAIYGA